MNKQRITIELDKKAIERLRWLAAQIFNDENMYGLVLERAIRDMYDNIVKEL